MDGETAAASANFLEWAKMIVGFLGPIAVVWVGAKMERSRKAAEKNDAAEKKEREEKDNATKSMISELENKVDRIGNEVDSIKQSVEEMQRMDEAVRSDLAMLGKYHELNVRHIQKVSSVVMAIGEGLRDEHIDGKMTSQVEGLRQFEQTMYSEILSHAPLSSADKDHK